MLASRSTASCLLFLLAMLAWGGEPCPAALTVLYDGQSELLPGDQEWLSYFGVGVGVSQQREQGGVLLESSLTGQAGYSSHTILGQPKNSAFPVLDRYAGFSLQFELQIRSENHISADRSGCSLILLDREHRGVELSFWETEIWSQDDDPLFRHGEGTIIDTTENVRYTLRIKGEEYTLSAAGSVILRGKLRDYSSAGSVPYTLDSYVFIGDDSTRGQASIVLKEIVLQDGLFSWNLLNPVLLRSEDR